MNSKTLRRALKEGYEDRGVFEPEERFWRAVKEVIDMLESKNEKKTKPEAPNSERLKKTARNRPRRAIIIAGGGGSARR